MPRKASQRISAVERAQKKRLICELVAAAKTQKEQAAAAGVSVRTIQDWRVKDEKFAVELSDAEKEGTDVLVAQLRQCALGEIQMTQQQMLSAFFLVKKRDPSYRENYKFEHTLNEGLAGALKQLAKAGRAG